MSYKEQTTYDLRVSESRRMRTRYPDRVPVIVENSTKGTKLPQIDKKKYLVPNDLTVGNFTYIIRKRIKLPPEQAMFIMINGNLCPTSSLMGSIYSTHADECGFLFVTIMGENTFGMN